MPKYRVYGSVSISVAVEVEADDKDAAIEAAYENFGGLTNYAGNGGIDKLVGVYEENVSIETDGSEPVFTDAEVVK